MRYKRTNFSQGVAVLDELFDSIGFHDQFIWYLILSYEIKKLDENANIYGAAIAMMLVDNVSMANDTYHNEIYIRKMS